MKSKDNHEIFLCPNCLKEIPCNSCSLTISQRFRNLSSGSEQLDKYLKITHKRNRENPRNLPIFFIPPNEFDGKKLVEEGGEGVIYTSEWKNGINASGPETVALKMLSRTNMEKFINELDLQARLYGTYTPQVYGVTRDLNSGNYMIVMEYAEYGDLRKYLTTNNNHNNLTFKDKLRMLKEIILAIKDIHSANLIHGDVHSGNILRGKHSFYVSDLGLCRPYTKELNKDSIFGVLPYVAPEVFLNKRYGPEADIYGFSIVAWEILSGKLYNNFSYDFDLIQLIIDGKRPPPVNGTPLQLWNLIQSCWNKDYAKRPTAKDLYSTLVKWLLFDKIYEKWENDLKNGITENFIYVTDEYDENFLGGDIRRQFSVSNSFSFHDTNPSVSTSRNPSTVISDVSEDNENNPYVSVQIGLTIPDNLSE